MQPSTPLISFCQHFPLFCVRRRTFGTKCCSSSGDLWTFVVLLNYITSCARPHCRHLSGFFSLLDPCFKSYALLRTSLCSISLVIFIPDHGVHLHSHHAKQHFILMCTCTRSTHQSPSRSVTCWQTCPALQGIGFGTGLIFLLTLYRVWLAA